VYVKDATRGEEGGSATDWPSLLPTPECIFLAATLL
jgi:hypothetical protein